MDALELNSSCLRMVQVDIHYGKIGKEGSIIRAGISFHCWAVPVQCGVNERKR